MTIEMCLYVIMIMLTFIIGILAGLFGASVATFKNLKDELERQRDEREKLEVKKIKVE